MGLAPRDLPPAHRLSRAPSGTLPQGLRCIVADEDEVDFDAFLRILRSETPHSLDQFEARLRRPSSSESLASIAASEAAHGSASGALGPSQSASLPPVAEEQPCV